MIPLFCVCVLQVFVGLSFPYEGPAPLEALANGCIFLNPKLKPPRTRLNSDFFKDKPNIREVRDGDLCRNVSLTRNINAFLWLILEWFSVQVTSQHPYAEAIGEPYVWMVDMDNSTDVERAVKSIINQTVSVFMKSSTGSQDSTGSLHSPACLRSRSSPTFPMSSPVRGCSRESMSWLKDRLAPIFSYVSSQLCQQQHFFPHILFFFPSSQDFCSNTTNWPPLSALQVVRAAANTSCKTACQEQGLICEPAFFPHLNGVQSLAK